MSTPSLDPFHPSRERVHFPGVPGTVEPTDEAISALEEARPVESLEVPVGTMGAYQDQPPAAVEQAPETEQTDEPREVIDPTTGLVAPPAAPSASAPVEFGNPTLTVGDPEADEAPKRRTRKAADDTKDGEA